MNILVVLFAPATDLAAKVGIESLVAGSLMHNNIRLIIAKEIDDFSNRELALTNIIADSQMFHIERIGVILEASADLLKHGCSEADISVLDASELACWFEWADYRIIK